MGDIGERTRARGRRRAGVALALALVALGALDSAVWGDTAAVQSPKKWHPGHYVRANCLGFPKSDAQRFDAYDRIRHDPLFQGGLIVATWGMLEPEKDVYDFSQIDKDLAYLKAMGKRLIIEVWWMQYGGEPKPSYYPQYLLDAGAVKVLPGDSHTSTVKVNEPQWMDRLVKLYTELGKRYDSDPAVEQIIITETALTPAAEFKRAIPEIAAAWPTTPVVLYMNWVDSPELARDLAATCDQYGVGLGAPDVSPPKPISRYGEDHGERVLRGAGKDASGDWGSIDYRGRIPVSYSYEANKNCGAPATFVDYALDTLKATHLVWGVYDDDGEGWDWKTGVLPVVKGVKGRINAAVPTSFTRAAASSGAAPAPAPSSAAREPVKWHPGHYVRGYCLGFEKDDQQRFATYDRIRDEPLFQGGAISVTWAQVEPQKGVYDFSQIGKDLAYLKAMNKRLIIAIWTSQYGGEMSNAYFPDWMIAEGGVKPQGSAYTARLDEPYWMDRLIALYQALGRKYDSDPCVEHVIISETAMTPGSREFLRLIPAVAAAFPNTSTALHMNWVSSAEYARQLVAVCDMYGVGIGGPDILPPYPIAPYSEDHGSLVLRGAGTVWHDHEGHQVTDPDPSRGDLTSADFGSIDYRGRLPVVYEFQAQQAYIDWGLTPRKVIDYALDTLRVTHVIWTSTESLTPELNWSTGILPTVKAIKGRINTAVPTSFGNWQSSLAAGCGTPESDQRRGRCR